MTTTSNIRYFYTCPYKAAYMAKYFGMTFNDGIGNEETVIHYGVNEGVERFELDPDKIHLLDPQVNDGVHYYVTSEPDYFSQPEARTKEHFKRVTKHLMFYLKHKKGVNHLRIVQRGGIAFIWPVSGAV